MDRPSPQRLYKNISIIYAKFKRWANSLQLICCLLNIYFDSITSSPRRIQGSQQKLLNFEMALIVIYDPPTLALVLALIALIVRLPLSQSLLCRISSSLKTRSLRLILCRHFLPTLSSISKSTLYPVFQGPEFGRVAASLMFSLSKMGSYTQSLRLYMISTDLWSVSRRMNYHSLNRKPGKVFIVTVSGAVTYSMECSDRIR